MNQIYTKAETIQLPDDWMQPVRNCNILKQRENQNRIDRRKMLYEILIVRKEIGASRKNTGKKQDTTQHFSYS